jgi:hypothetical protein
VTLTDGPEGEQLFALAKTVRVSSELYSELKVLFGRAAVGAPRTDSKASDSNDTAATGGDTPEATPPEPNDLPEPPEDLGF